MRQILRLVVLATVIMALSVVLSFAQAPTTASLSTPTSAGTIVVIPISATNIVNTQTTLTIPAPAGGLSNYICSLAYELGNDNTGTVVTNAVSTSTNFNAFAVKVSQVATASIDSGVLTAFQSDAAGGCSKSTVPGTATTFVSTASLLHTTWTWYATYFQAP